MSHRRTEVELGSNCFGLCLDCSWSMKDKMDGGTRLDAAKTAAQSAIQIPAREWPECRIWIGCFCRHFTCLAPPLPAGENLAILLDAVKRIEFDNDTRYRPALEGALSVFSMASGNRRQGFWNRLLPAREHDIVPAGSRMLLLFLSDGHNLGADPAPAAEQLKAFGVEIHTVGVGEKPSEVDEAQLKKIASWDRGKNAPFYRFIKDAAMLAEHFAQTARRLTIRQESEDYANE